MSLAADVPTPAPQLPRCRFKIVWPTTPRVRASDEQNLEDLAFKRMVISEINGHGNGVHCTSSCNCFNAQKWVNRRWKGMSFKRVRRVYDAVHDCD